MSLPESEDRLTGLRRLVKVANTGNPTMSTVASNAPKLSITNDDGKPVEIDAALAKTLEAITKQAGHAPCTWNFKLSYKHGRVANIQASPNI